MLPVVLCRTTSHQTRLLNMHQNDSSGPSWQCFCRWPWHLPKPKPASSCSRRKV